MKNNYEQLFNRFWLMYPLKVHKKTAHRIFIRRCKQGHGEKILKCLEGYINHLKRYRRATGDDKWMMHASTFLNDERYLDYEGIKYKPL